MRDARVWFGISCLVAVLAACSDRAPTESEGDPLSGLARATASDSAGNPLPAPPPPSDSSGGTPSSGGQSGPGYFRGTVRSSEGVQGPDTLSGSVRVANVRIVAYARQANGEAGEAVASTTSSSVGEWQLPTMPNGEYIVTFTPPSGSPYQGVWVTARAHAHSHEWPWWVTLPRR